MDLNINDPEQIKQIISVLQALLPKETTRDEEETNVSKIKTKTTKTAGRRSTENKFLNMPEKNMHKADSKIDKKLNINPPTPRTRKFVPIEVQCRVCGKKDKVSASVIPESIDRYKCNKCSSSGS